MHVQNTQAESQKLSFMQTQVSALCALGAGHTPSLTACLGLSLDQETRARPSPLMIGHPRLNAPALVCLFYFPVSPEPKCQTLRERKNDKEL